MTAHIFKAWNQPATKYKCDAGFWIKNPPRRIFKCLICSKRRTAKNMVVQSYYDGDRFFCKEGCK